MPSNWDSWGKIRILTEGFDLEGISTAWSIEIQDPPEPLLNGSIDEESHPGTAEDGTSAVVIYEQTIRDPKRDSTIPHPGSQQNGDKVEVETSDMQVFLTEQLEILEQLKIDDEKDRAASSVPKLEMSPLDDNGKVNEHIGPVQFNMGGIQVDADDMLRKLKVSREIYSTKVLLAFISPSNINGFHRRAKLPVVHTGKRPYRHLPGTKRRTTKPLPTSLQA